MKIIIFYVILWKSGLHGLKEQNLSRPLKEGDTVSLHCTTEKIFWVLSSRKFRVTHIS